MATLGDGRVLVVGGVLDSGTGGYSYTDQQELDNPSYMIYTPATRRAAAGAEQGGAGAAGEGGGYVAQGVWASAAAAPSGWLAN